VDLSNAPPGYAILWPRQPWAWAAALRAQLQAHDGVHDLGVIITDSQVTPLRQGVVGLALAYAGLEGVQNEVGRPDLYARPLTMTRKAVADGLASAAVLLMGEADERTPFVLIRGAPVRFTDRAIDPSETRIDPRQDLFAAVYHDQVWAAL
jgi:F420-0:gamma-glutamyl ligase